MVDLLKMLVQTINRISPDLDLPASTSPACPGKYVKFKAKSDKTLKHCKNKQPQAHKVIAVVNVPPSPYPAPGYAPWP